MRGLAAGLYAVVAAAMVLGGAGLVVVPHQDRASAEPGHEHAVTVYRFPILLVGDAPGVPRMDELAHHVAAAHRMHLRALLGLGGPTAEPVHPMADLAAGAVLALLVIAVPRLPRPTRRPIAEIAIPTLVTQQWSDPLFAPPPRARVFVTA